VACVFTGIINFRYMVGLFYCLVAVFLVTCWWWTRPM